MGKKYISKKLFAITVLLILLSSVLGNGVITKSYGGDFIQITEVPYIVLILIKLDKTVGKCSGSIISEQWILTAGHCFRKAQIKHIEVIAGMDDMNKTDGSQSRKPKELIVHPYYKDKMAKWDFALLRVDKFDMNSNRVGILELSNEIWPQNNDMYNRNCLAVGWGLPDDITRNNTKLHATNVIAEHGAKACKCQHSYQKKRTVCLKSVAGKGICAGDSGGPLICDGKGYGVAHVIYDLSSCRIMEVLRPVLCGRETTISVYMYICPQLNWINKYVKSVPNLPQSCNATNLFPKLALVIFTAAIILHDQFFIFFWH